LEVEMVQVRQALLSNLLTVVENVNVEEDLQLYVQREKKSELTHKYSKALDLLEWDYAKRCAAVTAQEMEGIMTINGKLVTSSSTTQPSASPTVFLDSAPVDDDFRLISSPAPSLADNGGGIVLEVAKQRSSSAVMSSSPPILPSFSKVAPRLFARSSIKIENPSTVAELSTLSTSLHSNDEHGVLMSSGSSQQEHSLAASNNDSHSQTEDIEDTADESNEILDHVSGANAIMSQSSDDALSDESGLTADQISTYEASVKQALDDIFSACQQINPSNGLSVDEIAIRLDVLHHEDRWKEILILQRCRSIFLQDLDDKRGTHAELNRSSFRAMELAMKVG
jgi:hypothetical protein